MKVLNYAILLSVSAIVLPAHGAFALEARPVSITCSPSTKIQSSIDAALPSEATTITVSGTCRENISIPAGKIITIIGANGTAKITAANAAQPAVTSYGTTTVQSMTVQNLSGTAEAVMMADRGGYLQVVGSKVSGPSVGSAVGIWRNSAGVISNSKITGGTTAAIELWDGSQLVVAGNPWDARGPDGFKTVVSSNGAWAVGCGIGSSLTMRATTAGSSAGSIEINNSLVGIFGHECSAQLENATNSATNFTISGMPAGGSAIRGQKSSINIKKLNIVNNAGVGIDVQQSSVQVDGSSISGNAEGDILSGYRSSILFTGWYNKNTMPQAFSMNTMKCYPTNKADIFIESSAIAVPAGKTMGDIATNNSCVTLGD